MSNLIFNLFDGGVETTLKKNQMLFHSGGKVRSMYFVLEGGIDLFRYTEHGTSLMLQRAKQGQVLAEASAYSLTYHCDGRSSLSSSLRSIPISVFHKRLADNKFIAAKWAEGLAHALQAARMNSEIRTLRKVSERLDVWFGGNKSMPPKGEWQDLAQTLGVTREALYRELSKRRQRSCTR